MSFIQRGVVVASLWCLLFGVGAASVVVARVVGFGIFVFIWRYWCVVYMGGVPNRGSSEVA